MAQHLSINESIASETYHPKIRKSVTIPSNMPAAERVLSVSSRVEISSYEVGNGFVLINGIIRSHFYYATIDDSADVQSFRRNFQFSERITVSGARRGYEADIELTISDIKFTLINNRSIEVVFTLSSNIELYAAGSITLVDERREIQLRRREMRVQRTLRESRFERTLQDSLRLAKEISGLRRVVDIDSSIEILETRTRNNTVRVRGVVKSDILFISTRGELEYVDYIYNFNEVFAFNGARVGMDAFVEVSIVDERVTMIDSRTIKIKTDVIFTILVVEDDVLDVPTDIIRPSDKVYPVRRPILVEQIVAERKTRLSARSRVTLAEGKPDVGRVISANGTIRGGSVVSSVENGGVAISGVVDTNVIYVADLPDQPVFYTSATVSFDSFINIPEVQAGMTAYTDISINRITARRVSNRIIEVRAVINVDLLVTERVQVPVVTEITDRPVRPADKAIHRPAGSEGKVEYTIKSGDTLYKIARENSITIERIIALNPGIEPDRLQVGQRIWIPVN
ncbi:MAG: SPOCS domain-containing protein [Halanaerobiaceae bacterium]